MKIRIDYIAQAKKAAGTGSETLTIADGRRLGDLLAELTAKHGAALSSLVFGPDGRVRPSIMITINDEQVFANTAPALNDGDVVAVMTPMSGG